MSIKDLEDRIRRLEDLEAIRTLKASFGYLYDQRNWAGVSNLLADDVTGDFPMGVFEGREAVIRVMQDNVSSFSMHNHSNPVIRLDGDRAAATWYVLTPVIDKQTNKPHWIAATYEDEYVRVERSWKFRKICAKVIFSAPYDTGWVEKREQ